MVLRSWSSIRGTSCALAAEWRRSSQEMAWRIGFIAPPLALEPIHVGRLAEIDRTVARCS